MENAPEILYSTIFDFLHTLYLILVKFLFLINHNTKERIK